MCKWIKDILFPLNLCGKKMRCVEFNTSSTPAVDNKKTFTIDWVGERLEVSWTMLHSVRSAPGRHTPSTPSYHPNKIVYANGGTEAIETEHRGDVIIRRIYLNTLYFKCTNVTSLIVNGEQII